MHAFVYMSPYKCKLFHLNCKQLTFTQNRVRVKGVKWEWNPIWILILAKIF